MDKKLVNFRLSLELLEKLEKFSTESGQTKTQLIGEAVECLISTKTKTDKEIQLLEKQNQQLIQALQGFRIALQGKDELIKEKEERIIELKETIEILKENQSKKKKWKFWV